MDRLAVINSRTLIGVGLYTLAEAAGLTGIPSSRIRRWLAGYAYGTQGWSELLWTPQLPRIGKDMSLGFRDLMELRLVSKFVSIGISLHVIRRALAVGRQIMGDERPFSTARFHTDGRTIFLQVSDEIDEPTLIDLLRKQYAFNRMVEPSFRDVDIGKGVVERWWPMSRRSQVMVDPAFNFGHPIVAAHGVPTRAVADALAAKGSMTTVAKVFDLPVAAVRDAVAFEQRAA